MAQTFLIFDFGANEEAAQQARHMVDRWKQGFRLDKKLMLKFDRKEEEQNEAEAAEGTAPEAKGGKKGKKASNKSAAGEKDKEHITLIVRLDFSDHEKLSYQRWLERIPTEAPFKDAHPKVLRHSDAEFAELAERFETLD